MISAVRFYDDSGLDHSDTKERLDQALSMAQKIRARLNVIDLRSYEPLTANAAVQLMIPGATQQVLQCSRDAMKLLARIPSLFPGGEHLGKVVGEGQPELALVRSDIYAIEGEPDPKRDRFCEELEETVRECTALGSSDPDLEMFSSTCANLVMELRTCNERVRRERDRQSKWGMIAEAYDSRRKAHHALRGGLSLAYRLLGPVDTKSLFGSETELDSALQVRGALLAFRHEMLHFAGGCEAMADWEVAIRVRDFRICILSLFSAPGYGELRPVDRFSLNRLRDHLSEFVDGTWDKPEQARAMVEEVVAFCEPLRFINNRVSLREHDAEVLQSSRAAIETMLRQPGDDAELWSRFSTVMGQLFHLRWRFEDLGVRLEQDRALGIGAPGTLSARVKQLASYLLELQI